MVTGKSCANLAMSAAFTLLAMASAPASADMETLLDKLHEKGVLSDEDYQEMRTEARADRRAQALKDAKEEEKKQEPPPDANKIRISEALKSIEFYGDVRTRYEDRIGRSNVPTVGAASGTPVTTPDALDRQRWRYALRLGVRGDASENFFYGLRLDTSTNPRSPWVTFGDDSVAGPGPSAKNSDAINVGQVFIGWRATDWLTLQAGKGPNQLFTSPMVWDPDISPEGLTERINYKLTDAFTTFATFGQWVYQDFNPDNTTWQSLGFNKQDMFMYAWEVGGQYKVSDLTSLRGAVNYYTYTGGKKTGTSFNTVFTGEPTVTANGNFNNAANQIGINDLRVIEVPLEFKFPLWRYAGMLYGNFAKNLDGSDRASAAGKSAYGNQDKAYQVGLSIGSQGVAYGPTQGLVYGTSAKKGTWEARTYYQRVEQFALDPNIVDSDFFEGRTNMKGYYFAVAYSPVDAVITTFRYGQGSRLNAALGTGGDNPDLPALNPVTDMKLMQFDLTLRF
ncbi:MAG TPA: putative porin [Burkholderiales bacterium]|nr:putative porin [Burkholderiales bacterium]